MTVDWMLNFKVVKLFITSTRFYDLKCIYNNCKCLIKLVPSELSM